VPLAGIEPALLAELDFESSASTNSATGALTARGRDGGVYSAGAGAVNMIAQICWRNSASKRPLEEMRDFADHAAPE
jgi:hypothetical protein